MRFEESDVLVVVDVQNDFLPGGALAVPDGEAVIAPINRLAARAPHLVLTQDWHLPGHASFASQHPGRVPFETVSVPYGEQMLWPDHCMQGTTGADLASGLDIDRATLILRKGTQSRVDSYSAFLEADRTTRTGLGGYLRDRGLTRIVLAGLATDFCILWTALDARADGFAVTVVDDAVRGIGTDDSLERAWATMERAGVGRIRSNTLT